MSTVVVLLACNAHLMRSLSAPISRRDNVHETTHWVSEPSGRGTFSLLVSCVLTLILCMWTSLHLNIPAQNQTPMGRFANKFLWTLLALFAPELVVFTAWSQWVSAKALCQQVNEILDRKAAQAKASNEQHGDIGGRWSMVHGFFAGMGGFAFEIDNSKQPWIRNKPTSFRVTLTPFGVLRLAEYGHLPNISEEFIADKSKADSLAKTLVCVQAAWCLLQYIGRLASHLPITLLEVNTLGHALCALGIYMSWWCKPLDISDPYVLSGEWVPPLCAYMWMASTVGSGSLDHENCVHREGYYLEILNKPSGIRRSDGIDGGQSVQLQQAGNLPGTCFKLQSFLFNARKCKKRVWTSPVRYHIERSTEPVSQSLLLHPEDVRRWRLATKAIAQHNGLKDHFKGYNKDFLMKSIGNVHGDHLLQGDVSSSSFALALAFVSTAYGGLHASGWNDFFPTWHECLMWRISAVVVAAAGIAVSLFIVSYKSVKKAFPHFSFDGPNEDTILGKFILFTLLFIVGLTLIMYCCCRIFLVVEAFISIRQLPIDAYQTPEWTQLLPHL